jgi:hypothetical protein
MNKNILLYIAFLCSGLWAGCTKAPSITAGVQKVEIPAIGGEVSVPVEANVPWTVTGNDWITATPEGDNTLKLQAAPNRQAVRRSAKIVCVAQTAEVSITVSQGAVTPVQSDSLALVALYHATGGANWTRRWTLTRPLSQWPGLTLTENGRVAVLDVSNNNLTGELPEDWCYLDQLQYCLLNQNQLSGTIPDGINRLTGLVVLDLSENAFTGAIPDMTALAGLRMMDLSENNFKADAIPAFLSQLTQLEDLRLSRTNLTGALPAAWQLVKLHTLDLSYNAFSGAIPDWAAMTALRVFYLYQSALSGSIPSFIANLPALEWLALDGNALTGAIPDGSYARLEKLWLINNQLTGDIPAAIKNNSKWNTFHVCAGNGLNNCTGDNANPADHAIALSAQRQDVHEKPSKAAYLPGALKNKN